ncbi:unnamed protein product [Paramecium primaurelia]|uniref:Uncharacterized protein n=1 Tax=Paramecium primaurelia TaxID=5886 RepID=A0A8S1N8I1_PARPR|nr:unnamed protein product [Paramecium primaurelia]
MSLSNQIFSLLSSPETYKQIKQYITRLRDQDENVYQPICDAIIKGLNVKDHVYNLMAAQLGKESVEQQNMDFNIIFQEVCLPKYEKIAEFKKDDLSDDRGRYYFSETPSKEQSSQGISLLRIILESIEVWAKTYTCKSDKITQTLFFQTYFKLCVKKIKFPHEYKYYNIDEVQKNISSQFQTLIYHLTKNQNENKSNSMQQTSQIIQQDQQQKQIQFKKQILIRKSSSISTPIDEKEAEIISKAQKFKNKFNLLKNQLSEKALRNNFKSTQQYIKDLTEVNQSLEQLMKDLDNNFEEFSSQYDEDIALELLEISDQLKVLCQLFKKLQKNELTPQNYRNTVEKYTKQVPDQKKDKLNYEQQMEDFQIQYNQIIEQKEKEKQIIQQEHEKKVSNLEQQITDSNQQRNLLEGQLKQLQINYRELKNNSIQQQDLERMNNNLIEQIRELNLQYEQMQRQSEENSLKIENQRFKISKLKEDKQKIQQEIENLKSQYNSDITQLINQNRQLTENQNRTINQFQDQNELNREISELKKQLKTERIRSGLLMEENKQINQTILNLQQQLSTRDQTQQTNQFVGQHNQDLQQCQAELINYKQQLRQLEALKKTEEHQYIEKINNLEQQLQIQLKESEKHKTQSISLNQQIIELRKELQKQKKQSGQEQIIQFENQQPKSNYNLEQATQRANSNKREQTQPSTQRVNSNKREQTQTSVPYFDYQHFQNNQIDFFENVQNLFTKTQSQKIPLKSEIMIYPHQTAESYYNKKVQPHKGIVIKFHNFLQNRLINQNNLTLYKIYHLNRINHTIFVDNQELKIGVLKQVQQNSFDYYINYGLYLETGFKCLKLNACIKNSMNFKTIWTSFQEIQQNLYYKQQMLLEVSIKVREREMNEVPILEINYNNKIEQILLPIQILCLIQYHKINYNRYQTRWKTSKIYRSEVFEYNQLVLTDHKDITKLNQCFSIKNPDKINSYCQGFDEIKYIAQFGLKQYNVEGIIKFELMPDNKMIIYVGIENGMNSSLIKRLINAYQNIFIQV